MTTNSGNGQPTTNQERLRELQRLEEMVGNVLTSRQEFFRNLMDPRRDIEEECGYPILGHAISQRLYQDLFERESVAARVVEVLPRESWQVQPIVYEDESSDSATPFEEAWDELGSQLRGEQSYYKDDKGNPVWEYLRRADELSGVGQFGIILLGLDDGKDLREPVEGMEIGTPTAPGDSIGLSGNPISDRSQPVTSNPNPMGPYSGSVQGADAQYFQSSTLIPGGQLPAGSVDSTKDYRSTSKRQPSEDDGEDKEGEGEDGQPKKGRRKLLYLRVFPESLVQITQFESRPTSPRFGQPVMYLITFNDPREQHGGVGLPIASLNVHWSRVIHVADTQHQAGSSEVFAVPRMRPVLNNLLGLRKLYSGSPEMYWRGAFPGLSFETHPQLGGDVDIDKQGLRDMYEEYSNGLQRVLFLMGMSAKTLSPTVSDPTPQVDVQLTAICIKINCPKRVFMGSERGELASSQDDQAWNDRLRERQADYITPRIIVPFIDRLIAVGVLPKPNVRKPAPQVTKPFALKKPEPPPAPGGPPGMGAPGDAMGGPPSGPPAPPGSKPEPPASGIPPAGPPKPFKPPFPPKPSFNRRGAVANAFPPTVRPSIQPTSSQAGRTVPGGLGRPVTEGAVSDEEEDEGAESPLDPEQEQAPESLPSGMTPELAAPPQKPQKPGYRIEWPDLTSQSDSEKATVANTRTTALGAYISGGVDALVPPLEFLTKIMGMEEEEAQSIIDAAAKAQEDAAAEEEAQKAQEGGGVDPMTGEPIPPAPEGSSPNAPPDPTAPADAAFSSLGGSKPPFPPKVPPPAPGSGIMPKSPLVKE